MKEGERIVAEALRRFPVKHALCIHRVGSLGSGRHGGVGRGEFRASRRSLRCLPLHHRRSQASRADLEERALSQRRFRLGELRALRGGTAACSRRTITHASRAIRVALACSPIIRGRYCSRRSAPQGQAALGARPRAHRRRRRPRQSGAAIPGRRRRRLLGVDRCRHPGCQQFASPADLRARAMSASRRRTWPRAAVAAHQSHRAGRNARRALRRRQRARLDPRATTSWSIAAIIFAPSI